MITHPTPAAILAAAAAVAAVAVAVVVAAAAARVMTTTLSGAESCQRGHTFCDAADGSSGARYAGSHASRTSEHMHAPRARAP